MWHVINECSFLSDLLIDSNNQPTYKMSMSVMIWWRRHCLATWVRLLCCTLGIWLVSWSQSVLLIGQRPAAPSFHSRERSHFEAARRTQRKSQTKEGQKKFFVDRKVEILKVYVKVSCFVLIFQCPRCVIILTESDLDQFLTGKKELKRKIGMSQFLDWNGSRVLKTCYIKYSPHISICVKQCLDSGHKCLE